MCRLVSKIHRVRYLKASPWVGARPVLGDGAHRSLGRCSPVPWGVHLSLWRESLGVGPVRLDRGPPYSPPLDQPRLGLLSQSTVGFAPTRHPSYSPPLWCPSRHETHLTPCEHVLCQTAQTPTLSQWDPAARLVMGCSHCKTPATYLNYGPCSCLGSSQEVACPPLPNGCGRQLHGPETETGQKKGKTSDVA